jgi:methylated-DNA-[protein]-cysteine S-methyltransferase
MSQAHHHAAVIRLPFGMVGIETTPEAISHVEFLPPEAPEQAPGNVLAQRAAEALQCYVDDPEFPLELPVLLQGTKHQRRVWQALQALHFGETISYGALAQQLGSGARAVGNACRRNPVPLFVPCHRVVAKQDMGGFAGDREGGWTNIKRWLLEHETCQ